MRWIFQGRARSPACIGGLVFWSEQDAGNDGEQREAGGREGRDEPSRDMVG